MQLTLMDVSEPSATLASSILRIVNCSNAKNASSGDLLPLHLRFGISIFLHLPVPRRVTIKFNRINIIYGELLFHIRQVQQFAVDLLHPHDHIMP